MGAKPGTGRRLGQRAGRRRAWLSWLPPAVFQALEEAEPLPYPSDPPRWACWGPAASFRGPRASEGSVACSALPLPSAGTWGTKAACLPRPACQAEEICQLSLLDTLN